MPYRRSAELTPQALKAITFYIRGCSKDESMRLAGYPEASVRGNHQHFWGRKAVQAEIAERMRRLRVKTDITVERVVSFLMDMLTVDPSELYDESGKLRKDVPRDVARLLNWKTVRGQVSFEAVDKLRIVELIAKLTGIYHDTLKLEVTSDIHAKIAEARKRLAKEPIKLVAQEVKDVVD